MNRAIITNYRNLTFLLIYEENVLVECHPLIRKDHFQIGNIYIGRVEKVVKNIHAAFIRLDPDHVGYLPLNEKPAIILNRQLPKGLPSIAENDLVLVQVEQEAQKMKQARVTGNINLTGTYVSLDLLKGAVGVSRKITDRAKTEQLKQMAVSLASDYESGCPYGYIFRTACESADPLLIKDEFCSLTQQMEQLIHHATYERKSGCILKGKTDYLALLESYGLSKIDEIKTDQTEIASNLREVHGNVCLYEDTAYPLYKVLSLESELDHLLRKKVWLKSGGFLVIEPTEAMVVIDVNSGKSI